jgi:hypothetical protein
VNSVVVCKLQDSDSGWDSNDTNHCKNYPDVTVTMLDRKTVHTRSLTACYMITTQGDQKVSVHLMITIQKVTSNVQSVPRQSPDIYWHAKLCSRRPCSVSVIPNSKYVIMVSDWNCLKYFCVFFCTVIIRCTETFDHPVWC